MIKKYLAGFLARHRRNRIVSGIDRSLVDLHHGYENLNYNYLENGETFVLENIRRKPAVETIFDVGADKGEWSKSAAERFPGAQIHFFEILPETYSDLVENCKAYPNIAPVALGLGDREEEREVYYSKGKSGKTTCVANFFETFHGGQPEVGMAKVSTGDRFCREQGVEAIDYLKIDVEGYEHKGLKGFQGMLQAGQIRIIQMGMATSPPISCSRTFINFYTPSACELARSIRIMWISESTGTRTRTSSAPTILQSIPPWMRSSTP